MQSILTRVFNKQIIKNIIAKLQLTNNKKYLRKIGVQTGDKAIVIGRPIISICHNSIISLADGVRLISISEETALGVNHACVLRTLAEGAQIIIKNGAGMSGATICSASKVIIGERVMLGANVTITDTDFHSLDWQKRWTANDIGNTSPVIIEDDVFVGMNTSILKNVRIGEKSIIGANSVVTRDIPPFSIAVGNPAKVICSVQDYLEQQCQ